MVRLQLKISEAKMSNYRRSQFHYGSITTLTNSFDMIAFSNQSQFHYGSITTIEIELIYVTNTM